jgi:drug/metabolite transporter (DMT)-like permease
MLSGGVMMNRTLGAILIVVGLVVLIWGGMGFQTRKKVLDIGPIEATKTTTHHVPYAPILGAVIAVTGAVLVARRD